MSDYANVDVKHSVDSDWCHTQYKELKGSFTWTISGFSHCIYDTGKFITSPDFSIAGDVENTWHLLLYPNGKTEEGKDFVAVFLHLKKAAKRFPLPITVQVSIVDALGDMKATIKLIHESNDSSGSEKFVSRNFLQDSKDKMLPEDELTLRCDLTTVAKLKKRWEGVPKLPEHFPSNRSIPDTMASDMGRLLHKPGPFSDVVFELGNEKFPAHKAVLMARCPIFADIFKKDVPRSQVTTVAIKGIEKPVFRELLSYIYTNDCLIKCVPSSLRLLSAAHKYRMPELGRRCFVYLNGNLSVSNVVDVATFADALGESELRDKCVEMICRELSSLDAAYDDWMRKLGACPRVLEEVLRLLPENCNSPCKKVKHE